MINVRKPVTKLLLGLMGVVVALVLMPSAPAAAAPGGSATAALLLTPKGCASGNFCVYTQGNGGSLCLTTPGNATDWGACANHDMTLFNNGTQATYDAVDVFWGRGYAGAYACLERGDYWLYATQNVFDHIGSKGGDGAKDGYTGLGEAVGNNAASHHWAQYC
jgi:hypothetical protein